MTFSFFCTGALAQLAPSPANDRPQAAQAAALDAAIAPYVAEARKSFPVAKSRFVQGLPSNEAFFVTVKLKDAKGHSERVFIRVAEIRGTTVLGSIANDIFLVDGFKAGQKYSVDESEILDWLIAKPDGSEEGNFVGKFLDTHQQ
jgi:uncharacterized protein YegJ (DUF2314 family)